VGPLPPLLHPVYKYPVMFRHERRLSILSLFFRGHDVESDVPPPEEMPTYRGLLNLALILLALSNIRLVMENIRKYGVLVDIASHFRGDVNPTEWPSVLTVLALGVPIATALALEQLALRQVQSVLRHHRGAAISSAGAGVSAVVLTPVPGATLLQTLNIAAVVVGPTLAMRWFHPSPAASLVVMMLVVILAAVRNACGAPSPRRTRLRTHPRRGPRHRNCGPTATSMRVCVSCTSSKVHPCARLCAPRTASTNGDGALVREGWTKDGSDRMYTPTDPAEYPNNLRVADLAYFVAAPTLCYETRFPRYRVCLPFWAVGRGG
jgi:hypothetical protein